MSKRREWLVLVRSFPLRDTWASSLHTEAWNPSGSKPHAGVQTLVADRRRRRGPTAILRLAERG